MGQALWKNGLTKAVGSEREKIDLSIIGTVQLKKTSTITK